MKIISSISGEIFYGGLCDRLSCVRSLYTIKTKPYQQFPNQQA
ncbi:MULTISPECIES: hypothetical protein [unclassified Nodularia (in: cyanobacteria)]|nr:MULTISPECIES: hypothetical protein [unclassified Nodularia (in: cyanobacteria)]